MGNQRHAEDLAGEFLRGAGILGELDAAALAAPAGVDLGLNHDPAAEFLGHLARFPGAKDDLTTGNRDTILPENLLGLVLVNFHDTLAARARIGGIKSEGNSQ